MRISPVRLTRSSVVSACARPWPMRAHRPSSATAQRRFRDCSFMCRSMWKAVELPESPGGRCPFGHSREGEITKVTAVARHPRTMTAPGISRRARGRSDPRECLLEIGDQVVGVFDACRIADETFRNAGIGPFLFGEFDVAGGARRTDEGADRTEARCLVRELHVFQHRDDLVESALQRKAQHAAEAAHLLLRYIV